jgi:hypothetical protein
MDVESIRSDCLSSRRQPKTCRGAMTCAAKSAVRFSWPKAPNNRHPIEKKATVKGKIDRRKS